MRKKGTGPSPGPASQFLRGRVLRRETLAPVRVAKQGDQETREVKNGEFREILESRKLKNGEFREILEPRRLKNGEFREILESKEIKELGVQGDFGVLEVR
jgi:hypothetical protein